MRRSTRVLLVEDYLPLRSFLSGFMRRLPDHEVVGEALDGLEAVQKAQDLSPDLILMDISLPRLNGIAATRLIREVSPESKILIVSLYRSFDIVSEAFLAGAR